MLHYIMNALLLAEYLMKPLTDLGQNYRHSCVRDLCWALASPPLMLVQDGVCRWYDDNWYRQLFHHSREWLDETDRRPEALLTMLQHNRDRRLGSYFETLWAYFFQCSPRFSLLARNIQIFDGNRTVGELDFVVRDHELQRNVHIELAIKFYLGAGNTQQQQNWLGPGRKDRLDIKMQTLLEKQSVLAHREPVRQQLLDNGIQIDDCAVIMKGRLFYPAARSDSIAPADSHPRHLRGQWWRYSDFNWQEGLQYMPLPRHGWMAEQHWQPQHAVRDREQLDSLLLAGSLYLPVLMLIFENGRELRRGFIVPDDWTNGN